MAIRVVARIRPRQADEVGQDIIVTTATAPAVATEKLKGIGTSISTASSVEESNFVTSNGGPATTLVRIPSPKNENEDFTFQFSRVYDEFASQQEIFDQEGWLFYGIGTCILS